MRNNDPLMILVVIGVVIAVVAFKGGIGYLIGRGKGKGGLGFFLGLFLGLLGWIIIAVIPGESTVNFQIQKRRCRKCQRVIPPRAVGCPTCRAVAAVPRVVSPDGRVACPWCAEMIMDGAKLCKFCHSKI